MQRLEFFRLLCWWSLVFALVVVLPRPLFAQVVMVDPMAAQRADNVRAEYVGTDLVAVTVRAVVVGVNENSEPVGYVESDHVISEADVLAGVEAFLAQPGRTDERAALANYGAMSSGGALVYPAFDVSVFEQGSQLELDAAVVGLVASSWADWDAYVFGLHNSNNWAGDTRYCTQHVYAYNADLNPSFDVNASAAPVGAYVRYFVRSENVGDVGCAGSSGSYQNVPFVGDDVGGFFPLAVGSDDPPMLFGGVLDQKDRSDAILLSGGLDSLADFATGVYETDAFEGYPQFLLYFGFFAGSPDVPENEGDCGGTWCSGAGGGGGGGGGFDCVANPDSVACAGTDVTELLDGEDEEVPGTEITVEAVEVEGLTVADGVGVCPANITVAAVDGFEFEMQPLCDGLTDARPFVEMFGVLMAAVIIATALRV